jgi:hypothetical protein
MEPVSWLLLRLIDLSDVSPLNDGMDPVSWLSLKLIDSTFVSPFSDGKDQVRPDPLEL